MASGATLRAMRYRIAVLVLALSACAPPEVYSWHPATAAARTNEITKQAVEIGEDDLPKIQEVGGVLNGTITISSDSGTDPAEGAAYFGATHYLALDESHSTTAHGWRTATHTMTRYRVYRVPVTKWSKLPKHLRPAPL